MDKLLSEHELAIYEEMARDTAGAGTGTIPADLTLLMSHIRAQSAILRRQVTREQTLTEALDGLLDYLEHGGSDDQRAEAIERARQARRG